MISKESHRPGYLSLLQRSISAFIRPRSADGVSSEITKTLQDQPLMHEYWLAQHSTLRRIFQEINDPDYNTQIEELAQVQYRRMKRKVTRNTEQAYRELALGNAMRLIWSTDDRLQEEYAQRYATLMEEGLQGFGVWDEFQKLYHDENGDSTLVDTLPTELFLVQVN